MSEDFSGFFEYKEYCGDASGRCVGCESCKTVIASDGFSFKGCFHIPYHGKWIAEIQDCPKE